jgi:hypothetical protein
VAEAVPATVQAEEAAGKSQDNPNPDKPEPNRFEDKKIDHESTKIRRHESLNVVLFRVFNLSCFRDCVSKFSARKNAKIITKVLHNQCLQKLVELLQHSTRFIATEAELQLTELFP